MKGFVAVIVHVDLLADTSKAKLVSNHKGVHRVVLGQLRIGFLKIFDLFGIEYMDFPMEPAQIAILTECVYQIISINRGGFHADHHVFQSQLCERRHDFL